MRGLAQDFCFSVLQCSAEFLDLFGGVAPEEFHHPRQHVPAQGAKLSEPLFVEHLLSKNAV